MKILKQILFAAAVMLCFSLTASAQKQGDDKKPPEKKDPPIIIIKDKDKPKDNDRPKDDKKKPQSAYLKSSNEDETATA